MLDQLWPLTEEPMVYEHPPLVLAACEVRFGQVLSVANPAFVAPFQQAIVSEYPVGGQGENFELNIGLGAGAPQIQRATHSPHWEFTDRDDNWKVTLSLDRIILETRSYKRHSDLVERLQRLLEATVTHIRPSITTRIGLRYVNEVRPGEGVAWSSVIQHDLLGPLAVPKLSSHAVQSFQQLLLRYPENNEGINIRHGLFPQGTTVRPRPDEQAPSGPFYLLDFDAYREFPSLAGTLMDSEMICEHVARFNKAIYSLFLWAVLAEYRSTLGGTPR